MDEWMDEEETRKITDNEYKKKKLERTRCVGERVWFKLEEN